MPRASRLLTCFLIALLCLAAQRVRAAENDAAAAADAYDAEKLYITTRLAMWGISLSGDTGIRDFTTSVNDSFEDLLKDTNLAAFPSFELSKGNWVLALNGMYADLSSSEHITGLLGNGRGADISTTLGVADVAIGYTVIRANTTLGAPITLTPAIGGRWTYVEGEINPENFASRSDSRAWFDPYIGLQGVVGLTKNLDWRTAGTVGGFDVGSQFTWSVETMLEWRFSKRVGLDIGYRVLSWNYDRDNFVWDMTIQGPWIGLSFTF